jgi:hypothetical protein
VILVNVRDDYFFYGLVRDLFDLLQELIIERVTEVFGVDQNDAGLCHAYGAVAAGARDDVQTRRTVLMATIRNRKQIMLTVASRISTIRETTLIHEDMRG